MHRSRVLATALILTATAAQAQTPSIARQIDRAPDGRIRMSFETRPEICGDGRSIGEETPDGFVLHTLENHGYSIQTYEDWVPDCDRGPLRLVVTKSGGRVVDLAAAVGVEWKPEDAVPDLGMVESAEAASWLLDVAAEGNDDVGRIAFLAANAAADALIAERLFDMAQDRALDSDVRQRAMRWLNRAAAREGKSDAADRVLRKVAESRSDVYGVRERAIRQLRETDANDAYLRSLYSGIDNRDLKERIIRRLGESPSTDNVGWIETIATTRGEPVELRERAIRVIGEGAAIDDLIQLYEALDAVQLRERVVRIVGQMRTPASSDWLRSVALDANDRIELRERALRVLCEGDPAAARALFDRLESVQLKDRALRMAGEARDSGTNEWLRDIAVDQTQRSEFRDRALRILAARAIASAELGGLYDRLNRSDLRRRVIRILADRADEQAIDKLIAIAESDPDPDLRRYAVRRLGESDDQKAREFFEEMLRRPR